MPILDFKEIPEAHIASGKQDAFELFAREFLHAVGYDIIEEPDRGADGGRDLIVEEKRTGVGGETRVRWLVSCKHKAHSGKSVRQTDEQNIRDRIEHNKCNGFLGFYSMLPSSGLNHFLQELKSNFDVQVLDNEKIEREILGNKNCSVIFERFFPSSFRKAKTNVTPAKIFNEDTSLKCYHCGKELLDKNYSGNVVVWYKEENSKRKTKKYIGVVKGSVTEHWNYKM
ncbi:restriction endonuclease [Magnetofaba australis]|uniref:Restriction endonuclease type IV Mrr domain-containing protein n=1 Tax=Magnetofaba australis IT-1 TaxID=1434232 RepID=A0A1Y2K004_9PROT|nr:restriction endonuclease [Magnetofaba australis]OSM00073.1 hypothetical protein MAIT1_05447 [Magnetofaba australis IT-1]